MSGTRDISMIIINAKSFYLDEDPDIVVPNIQNLINSMPMAVLEVYSDNSGLQHTGRRVKYNGRHITKDGIFKNTSLSDVVLAGGSLGNEHYKIFLDLVKAAKGLNHPADIHIPFNCTYSFESKSDSGDSWTEGVTASPDMWIFQAYRQAMARIKGTIIESGSARTAPQLGITMHLWDNWQDMVKYFGIESRNV